MLRAATIPTLRAGVALFATTGVVLGAASSATGAATPTIKVCVQKVGSRENLGDINTTRTFCGSQARFIVIPSTGRKGDRGARGERGPIGPVGPPGDQEPSWAWLVKLAAVVLEITGLVYLAREVLLGLEMDEIESQMPRTDLMLFLYTSGLWREYVIADRVFVGNSPAEARQFVDSMNKMDSLVESPTGDSINAYVEGAWADHAEDYAKRVHRWRTKTADAALQYRKKKLVFGSVLIGIAVALHLLV